jgi:glycine oxidase
VHTASHPKTLVIGGGILGCAIARELAGAGCRVLLLERGRVGGEASSAAAGILCPQAEATAPSPLVDLGVESQRLYPGFVEQVRQETGIDPGYESPGTLVLDITREDAGESLQARRWQQAAGLPVEAVTAREVASLEPGLGGTILGGLYYPRGGRVDPVLLTRGLCVAARLRGVEIREGSPVRRIQFSADRVIGVELEGGGCEEADVVVLAAGAWSSSLLPSGPQVFPVRGQIVVLESSRAPRRHVLIAHRAYLVPRRDGKVLVGSTQERVGFRKGVTPRALLRLVASAISIDPGLEESSLATAWSGFRPATADGLPILGEVMPGLLAATGHHRSGILLAPVTAALVAEQILRGRTTRDLTPFSPARRIPDAPFESGG